MRYGQTRQQMHDRHRKELFGLSPNQKWPKEGLPSILHNGTRFFVLSVEKAKELGHNRRCLAECPTCSKLVCAGHLEQHQQGKECRKSRYTGDLQPSTDIRIVVAAIPNCLPPWAHVLAMHAIALEQ